MTISQAFHIYTETISTMRLTEAKNYFFDLCILSIVAPHFFLVNLCDSRQVIVSILDTSGVA